MSKSDEEALEYYDKSDVKRQKEKDLENMKQSLADDPENIPLSGGAL